MQSCITALIACSSGCCWLMQLYREGAPPTLSKAAILTREVGVADHAAYSLSLMRIICLAESHQDRPVLSSAITTPSFQEGFQQIPILALGGAKYP